jgi:hypothetical protein
MALLFSIVWLPIANGLIARALMALDSVRRWLSGRTVWKGRIYS